MKRADYKIIEKQIEYLKDNYEFNGLVHFTDFSNLASILENGYLYSREYCNNNDLYFKDMANQEIISDTKDDIKNCVRFYYTYKSMTLYKTEGIKLNSNELHIPIPVYLLFDEELLYLDYIKFTNGNARANNTTIGDNGRFFYNLDWNAIFHIGSIDPSDYEFKRKMQAEVLSEKPISLKYLKKIIFRSNTDYKRACNLFGNKSLYHVDQKLFHNKENYIKSYNIETGNVLDNGEVEQFILNYELNKSFMFSSSEYCQTGHRLEIIDKDDSIYYQQDYNYLNHNHDNATLFYISIEDFPRNDFKINFYFCDILSVEEFIKF